MNDFDDAALDDPQILAEADDSLRFLAGAGARIRLEAQILGKPDFEAGRRPRGVIIVGQEARLVRAVLEPCCPVPFVAWPFAGLPAWVGALDLVVVLASRDGSDAALVSATYEAARRGAALLVATPEDSPVWAAAEGTSTLRVPTATGDPLAAAIALMSVLHEVELGPDVVPSDTAEVADMVAEESSPYRDLSTNAAKDLALGLADALPLVWGGSVLAARASRRVAEALRRATGLAALAVGSEELLPVIEATGPRDPFADPTEHQASLRPVLLVLNDMGDSPEMAVERQTLLETAQAHDVRICALDAGQGSDVDRYVALLQKGLYGAAYLRIGSRRGGTPGQQI
ncbi:phospho-glucose isomerase C-terminal SIS domain-containing protein [Propionibacterium cyclohexanicum]|uniref:Phospho-glucose isomerase C-terminal SIS domain-containing protein n=1 Tax=Propionibacterium cyclohexanicum TaxID=64702 RepID=A0A1H9QDU2_9ACTN|nr:SIS domain-containing protein [Propionibacterium cyclohexanicum]SER58592.1 phospho-glucose isomerase C-terminal SIS domain-containing protein [Propionibacterium cyclohexanicum]